MTGAPAAYPREYYFIMCVEQIGTQSNYLVGNNVTNSVSCKGGSLEKVNHGKHRKHVDRASCDSVFNVKDD